MVNRSRQGAGAWGVLLAGGDGTRLQSLTARIEGDLRPKQFCRLLGGQTLLTQTRHRIRSVFGDDKIVTVVTKKHEPFYERELCDLRNGALVVQPENRGTGVAIAATILKLLELDADAIVAFFPCDHHYIDEVAFLDVVEAGIVTAQNHPGTIVLVGAEPTYPEVEYGWIEQAGPLPNDQIFAPARVRRFWEKPNLQTAQELQRRGCLWNTFVTIGRASKFIEMLCRATPNAMLKLSASIASGDLESCFRWIAPVDFSRDVLASQPEHLLVIQDATSGWTDLGSPNRVLDTLARSGGAPNWLESFHRADLLPTG